MLPFYSLHYELLSACRAHFRQSTAEGSEGDGHRMVSYSMFSFLYEHFFLQFLQSIFPLLHLFNLLTADLILIYCTTALFRSLVCFGGKGHSSILSILICKFAFFILSRLQLATSWSSVTDFNILPFFCALCSCTLRLSLGCDQQMASARGISIPWSWSGLACKVLPYTHIFW